MPNYRYIFSSSVTLTSNFFLIFISKMLGWTYDKGGDYLVRTSRCILIPISNKSYNINKKLKSF